MLTEFSIGNYQAFNAPQRVPLKPITLIFGPNSSGKSALLRSLLVIKHALLRHSMSKGEGSHPLHPGQVSEFARKMGTIPLKLKVTSKLTEQGQNESLTFSGDIHSREGEVTCEHVEWSRNDLPLLRSKWNGKMKALVPEFVSDELRPSVEEISAAQIKTGQAVEDIVKTWLSESNRGLPSESLFMELAPNVNSSIQNTLKDLLVEETVAKDEAALEKVRKAIERISGLEKLAGGRARGEMHKVATTFHAAICRELQEMAYHEPLRPVPKRIDKTAKDDPALSEWWMLASDPDRLARVNRWFADNPHTKQHQLIFDRLLPVSRYADLVAQLGGEVTPDRAMEAAFEAKLEADGALADKLCEDHIYGNGLWDDNDPDGCDFDSKEEAMQASLDYIMNDSQELARNGWDYFDELADSGDMYSALEFLFSGVNALKRSYSRSLKAPWEHMEQADIYFEDVATKTKIPPSNLGTGFSQMAPFVSSALSSENRLIAIEQPELHVHPALQTELADLFIQSAKQRGNRFLIETHSEHLILRVMRRIRETTRNSLPEGKPPIKPEDVAILYVQPGDNGSTVQELRIDEQGRFLDRWPQGFFEERLDELF